MKKWRFLSVMVLLAVTLGASGQTDDGARLERLSNEVLPQSTSARLTGTTSASGTGTNRDFLSALLAALETLNKGKGEAITFDWNFDVLGAPTHRGKLQLVLKKPDLSAPLAKSLAGNDAALTALRKDLSYDDDVKFSVSIAPKVAEKKEILRRAFARHVNNVLTANEETLEVLPSDVDQRMFVESIIRQEARDAAAVITNFSKFSFDAAYQARHETAGPNEWLVKGTYEMAAPKPKENAALRTWRSFDVVSPEQSSSTDARAKVAAAKLSVNAFRDAIRKAADTPSVKRNYRLAFSVEAHLLTQGRLRFPAYTVDLPGKRSHSYAGSLSFGFDVYRPENSEQFGRLEIGSQYDDVTGEPNRHDRWVSNIKYTHRLTKDLTIPITLVYANHSDYLTNVDRKLNAHFGFSFNKAAKK